jgi:Na+-transporting methylmalonyl-CoA/oxaloacetate decarboxylase gamma subunit
MECAGMAVVLLALILLVSSVALAVTGAGAPTGRRERR